MEERTPTINIGQNWPNYGCRGRLLASVSSDEILSSSKYHAEGLLIFITTILVPRNRCFQTTHFTLVIMASESQPLHILFFPFMAAGHMIPMVDMAKLFSAHGVKTTILTTPANAAILSPILLHHPVTLHLIPFPSAAAGLPEGCENINSLPSQDLRAKFPAAISLFRQPFDDVLSFLNPDCVVSDMFLPWTADVANDHSIPRLEFHGTCFFSLSARVALDKHNTLDSLPPDAATVTIPTFPHKIEMLRSQMQNLTKRGPDFQQLFKAIKESEPKSYGVLVNSFYELEPDYADYYRNVVGRRAWHVGPVSLINTDVIHKESRVSMGASTIGTEDCYTWLSNKSTGSVVYVCFGSMGDFTEAQLAELALGLEASGQPFVWVVRNGGHLPDGFEQRVGDRGLIIRGWAPQTLILGHSAVGAFVTHCGWNSVLEGVSAGVPMVTWPLYAEQFFNERLVVDVLRLGVAVGSKVYSSTAAERPLVDAAEVERAVWEVMDSGEEAEGRRKKARELGETAKRAIEEGGSSFDDAEKLIKELLDMRGKTVESL